MTLEEELYDILANTAGDGGLQEYQFEDTVSKIIRELEKRNLISK